MIFPLAYLGYLGVAAAAAFLTSCNSEEKKSPEFKDPPISAEPPPQETTKLTVDENEPAYAVYLQLQAAGLSLFEMDRAPKKGEVNDDDLYFVGRNYLKYGHGSIQENKELAEKLQTTFKETSDRYFGMGAGQNGITFPEICKNLTMFKKSALWNRDNEHTQLALGVCQPDEKALRHAIKLNAKYVEQQLETYSRQATENKLEDPQALKNLNDALKIAKEK